MYRLYSNMYLFWVYRIFCKSSERRQCSFRILQFAAGSVWCSRKGGCSQPDSNCVWLFEPQKPKLYDTKSYYIHNKAGVPGNFSFLHGAICRWEYKWKNILFKKRHRKKPANSEFSSLNYRDPSFFFCHIMQEREGVISFWVFWTTIDAQ